MQHYTDAALLPLAEAIHSLPGFSKNLNSPDTQIDAQSPDASSAHRASTGMESEVEPARKIVPPEAFWRERSLQDTVKHGLESGCLARIRT